MGRVPATRRAPRDLTDVVDLARCDVDDELIGCVVLWIELHCVLGEEG